MYMLFCYCLFAERLKRGWLFHLPLYF